jgi:hypothetical protein
VDLGAHLVDLLEPQAEPLSHVVMRLVAATHPEDIAVVDVPLVRRTERRMSIRIFRELEDPIHATNVAAQ